MSFVTVDAFCGAGGLSLGLKRAGFRVGYAFDSDARAVESYRRGVGRLVHWHRAEDLAGSTVMAALNASKVDLFAGGPPCQGFSKQKRGAHKGDDRNRLASVGVRPASRGAIAPLLPLGKCGHVRPEAGSSVR